MELPKTIKVPNFEVEHIAVKLIKGYGHNAKKHPEEQIEVIKKSILEFGFRNPIILNNLNEKEIVAGHGRLMAAKELGMSTVPCISAEDLSPGQIKAFRIMDNKSQESDWDYELLKLDFADLNELGYDLELTGFSPEELGEQLQQISGEVEEDDFEPDLEKEPAYKIEKGEVWQLGEHRLMCGDSTLKEDVDVLMDGNKADMVFTDPPYGINADKMTMGSGAKEFHRGNWDCERPDISFILKLADKICIWGGNYFADILPVTNDWLCWHKKNDGLSFSEFELAWTNFGKNCRHLSHHWGNEKKQHVTMKPVSLCAWGIQQIDDAKLIIDLFGGSGSTLIACEQLNRSCYMMELDPKYCSVIIERWEALTGKEGQKL